MSWLRAYTTANSVGDIDFVALRSAGLHALLFDLDNTLTLWGGALDPQTASLLAELKSRGFRLAVVSNALPRRRSEVRRQLAMLGIPVIFRARKPLPGAFRRACLLLGARPQEGIVIGDQLFTDVLGAHLAGMHAVLVSPLNPREHWFTRLMRRAERVCGRR